MTIYCSSCGQPVRIENLGALIPDDEYGMKAYCKKCNSEAIEDLCKRKELDALV